MPKSVHRARRRRANALRSRHTAPRRGADRGATVQHSEILETASPARSHSGHATPRARRPSTATRDASPGHSELWTRGLRRARGAGDTRPVGACLRSRPVAHWPTGPGRAVRRRSFRRVARSAGGIWRRRRGAEARGDGRRSGDRRARAARARLRPRGGIAVCDDGRRRGGRGSRRGRWDSVATSAATWSWPGAPTRGTRSSPCWSSLDAEHHDYFHRVMRGCRILSNSRPEVDGLDDLLTDREQVMFDLAFDRERRREKQGYVTPAQARAFLQMSRQLRLGHDTTPPAQSRRPRVFPSHRMDDDSGGRERARSSRLPAASAAPPAPEDSAEAVAAVVDVLLEAGVLTQPPRALLDGSQGHAPRLARIQAHMQFARDRDHAAYSMRSQELAYLANTIMAGCSIQARPFTAQEASDAAVAVCNLGLENWPPHWLRPMHVAVPPSSKPERRCPTTFSSVTTSSACSRSGGPSSMTRSACTRQSD